jgi:hypothetical protein
MENSYKEGHAEFHKAIRIFFDFYLVISQDGYSEEKDRNASLLLQKFYLHSLGAFELGSMSHMLAPRKEKRFSILDPVSMNTLLRSAFEAYCCFNHVFVDPNGNEDKFLRHAFWKQAGLKSRTESPARYKVNKLKKQKELAQIQELEARIQKCPKVKKLPAKQTKKLQRFQSMSKWEFKIYNGEVIKFGWAEMLARSGMKKSLFGNQYNHLSWNSHPSYMALVQLNDMYTDSYHESNAQTLLFINKMLIYSIILDCCIYFEKAKEIFKKLPKETKAEIVMYNRMCRYKRKIDKIIPLLK